MERLFLDHTYRWLAMDGVLAMVIPFERLMDCAGLLSSHFAAINVFRMTDEESVRFRQIAVLGVRSNVRGAATVSWNFAFRALSGKWSLPYFQRTRPKIWQAASAKTDRATMRSGKQ
jgi:hypothetical protein